VGSSVRASNIAAICSQKGQKFARGSDLRGRRWCLLLHLRPVMSADNDHAPTKDLRKRTRVALADAHPVGRTGLKNILSMEPDLAVVAEASDEANVARAVAGIETDLLVMASELESDAVARAIRDLRAAAPKLPILIISSAVDPLRAGRVLAAGASGYLLKRSSCAEIIRAIRTVVSVGRYVDPSLDFHGAARSPRGSAPLLTRRESAVMRLVARGLTAKEVASSLGISPRTLETYKARAMSKLELQTRADLIRYALRSGWLDDS
jgi:DNA-binding NarL/FixJ family response regulator